MTDWVDNPLVQQNVQRGKWPMLRVVAWIAFGLGLLMVFVITRAILRMPAPAILSVWLMALGWLVALVSPAVVGMVAGVSTTRTVSSEAFELVRLTSLPEREIVRGLVGRVLYRLRILIGLNVAALPLIVLGMIYLTLVVTQIFCTITCSSLMYVGSPCACEPWPVFGPPAAWLTLLIVVADLWGMIGLAAALGVALGLNIRKGSTAGTITLLVMLPLTLGLAYGLLTLCSGGWITIAPGWLLFGLPLARRILLSTLILLVVSALPYVLTAGLMRLSRRWVK
ncbi:MAG: hypothetical protein JXJ17_09020 [Anaerolineae bacterium]|nr:hypothetical protein [Anaerolineae bacterium]